MAEAKAVINLKEGVIELQGPVEFVRQHLNTYQSAIRLQSSPSDIAVMPKREKPLSRKRRRAPGPKAGRAKLGLSTVAIRSYVKARFFDKPRALRDVRQHLNELGLTFRDNVIRASSKSFPGQANWRDSEELKLHATSDLYYPEPFGFCLRGD